MSSSNDLFRHDYDLDALQRIRPKGHAFDMVVTPRFCDHYVERRYEPLTSNLIRSIAGRKRVFLDVGAHYGFFTIVAGLSNPDIEIHAIEPLEENREILRRNLELNGLSSVTCHETAASNRTGRATLYKSRASDNSSFYPHPAAPPIAQIEVQTLQLSTLLEDRGGVPTLIKIDTDGHEIPVLEGLENVLSGNDDATLFVEINPKMQKRAGHDPADLLALLQGMGFSSFLLYEEEFRLLRVDSSSDWHDLIPDNGMGNLYCRPRSSSLSVCFMAHSHALAGAERSMADLVTQLIEDHGTVCNVVIPGEGSLRRQVEYVGAGVIPAEYGWWCSQDAKSAAEIHESLGDDLVRLLARTLPEIEATRPDLISTNSMVIPYGAIVAAILGKPHVWHLREYGGEIEGHRFYLSAVERWRFIENFSDIIFTASRRLAKTLFPHLGRDRIEHLYPSIQAPLREEPKGPKEAASNSPPLLLVDLAGIFEAKQQEIDVRTVAELTRRGHPVRLLLKGSQDPNYVQRLKQLAESLDVADRVEIEDFSNDIWSTLNRADVVLVSAPAHVFGRVAAEGMLGAKPVVYPRTTDIAEYMEEGVTGLAYDTGDFRSMADQVERLIQNPDLAGEIGEAAYRTARGLFTREGFGSKFLNRVRAPGVSKPGTRPPLPRLMVDSLIVGIQRLDRNGALLEEQARSQTEELASIKPVLEAKEKELASIKPVLEAKEKELASIKPVLEARDSELDVIQNRLGRLMSTRLGRLAAKLAKID